MLKHIYSSVWYNLQRNLEGVKGAREERKIRALVVTGEVREGGRIFWYDRKETGDALVGG